MAADTLTVPIGSVSAGGGAHLTEVVLRKEAACAARRAELSVRHPTNRSTGRRESTPMVRTRALREQGRLSTRHARNCRGAPSNGRRNGTGATLLQARSLAHSGRRSAACGRRQTAARRSRRVAVPTGRRRHTKARSGQHKRTSAHAHAHTRTSATPRESTRGDGAQRRSAGAALAAGARRHSDVQTSEGCRHQRRQTLRPRGPWTCVRRLRTAHVEPRHQHRRKRGDGVPIVVAHPCVGVRRRGAGYAFLSVMMAAGRASARARHRTSSDVSKEAAVGNKPLKRHCSRPGAERHARRHMPR